MTVNRKLRSSKQIFGKFNTNTTEQIPMYNKSESETIIQGKNNTFIVLGRDRPTSINSGYGGLGFPKCGTIDLVAGRASPFTKEEDSKDNVLYVDNSPEFDASRVLISQKTNVDKNFNLSAKNTFSSDGDAAICLKSDHIRLVSRKSLRLVTMPDKYDSNGNMISKAYGIELVAGNDDKDLQPMIKGDNLTEYLNKIQDILRIHNSEISFLHSMLSTLLQALSLHTHQSAMGPTSPSIELAAIVQTISSQIALHMVDRQNEAVKSTATRESFLTDYGSKSIKSKLNKVN